MKVNLSFNDHLNMLISNKSSFLCIGLDPDMDKIPAYLKYEKNPLDLFVREIVEATKDLVIAYKANLAFYESEGHNGVEALYNLATILPKDVLLILDGKRGDIENTTQKYAAAYFGKMGAHAVTAHPYMGYDSIKPFIDSKEQGAFILALTSNRGSSDFQFLQIGAEPLYLYLAKKVQSWNKLNNCGLVVAATEVEDMQILRRAIPDLPFLIPGVGTQGGILKEVLKYGRDQNGTGLLINVGRDIIYTDGSKNFAKAVKAKAQAYVDEMKNSMRTGWDFI